MTLHACLLQTVGCICEQQDKLRSQRFMLLFATLNAFEKLPARLRILDRNTNFLE